MSQRQASEIAPEQRLEDGIDDRYEGAGELVLLALLGGHGLGGGGGEVLDRLEDLRAQHVRHHAEPAWAAEQTATVTGQPASSPACTRSKQAQRGGEQQGLGSGSHEPGA